MDDMAFECEISTQSYVPRPLFHNQIWRGIRYRNRKLYAKKVQIVAHLISFIKQNRIIKAFAIFKNCKIFEFYIAIIARKFYTNGI